MLYKGAYAVSLHLCQAINAATTPDTILVGDGGDFVATASYILQPAGPLRWLDPGAFGTLGVGAGFALGAVMAAEWVKGKKGFFTMNDFMNDFFR